VNNEFKYGMQGLLMAIGFFVALKISLFIIQISPVPQMENEVGSPTTSVESIVSVNAEGKRLFSQNCASCHAIHKRLTGPALAGLEERIPDRKRLFDWIRNSQKVLQSGDEYFNALYNSYDKIQMNPFPDFTDKDIDNILDYISQYSRQAIIVAPAVIHCYFPNAE
jgi:cytochrome c2